jgi:hypothetical protein
MVGGAGVGGLGETDGTGVGDGADVGTYVSTTAIATTSDTPMAPPVVGKSIELTLETMVEAKVEELVISSWSESTSASALEGVIVADTFTEPALSSQDVSSFPTFEIVSRRPSTIVSHSVSVSVGVRAL